METTLDSPVNTSSASYGGFWIRFVAYLIDAIILVIVNVAIIMPILGVFGYSAFNMGEMNEDQMAAMMNYLTGAGLVIQIVQFAVGLLYFALMESSAKQGTIGKIALNLKVTGRDGGRITFGQAILRYLGKIISALVMMIGYIMAAFHPKKQALHDIIAGTYVIKT